MSFAGLKKSRSNIKGQLTNLQKYVNGNPVDDDPEMFSVRLQRAHGLMEQFSTIEEKLFEFTDEDIASEIDDVSEKYYCIVAGLNKLIRESKVDRHDGSLNRSNASNNEPPVPLEIRLPDIHIPKFHGDDITKWQPFFQLFSSAIDSSPKLDGTKKFFYLKSFLAGEASGLVEHLTLTEENYFQALKILKDRYGRRKHVINDYIKKFLAQPIISSGTHSSIRRILNTSEQITRGLDALGNGSDHRDHWLIHILLSKVDEETKRNWAHESATDSQNDSPSLDEFYAFLLLRSDCLESVDGTTSKGQRSFKPSHSNKQSSTSKNFITTTPTQSESRSESPACMYCKNGSHNLWECSSLKSLSVEKRRDFIKEDRRCFNCLGKSHSVYYCKSKSRCQKCGRKHHTLVHGLSSSDLEKSDAPKPSLEPSSSNNQQSSRTQSTNLYCQQHIQPKTLLPTAIVKVQNSLGDVVHGRALLDSCSVSSFISESFAQTLQLPRKNSRVAITGLGRNDVGLSKGSVSLTLMGQEISSPYTFNALVIPKITSKIPSSQINISNWNHIKGIELADPLFNVPADVDMLIGVELFFDILRPGCKRGTKGQVVAQNSALGWIVGGNCGEAHEIVCAHVGLSNNSGNDIDRLLKSFWEVESVPESSKSMHEGDLCEVLFTKSLKLKNGRFEVELPFVMEGMELGESRFMAMNRLRSIERRFERDPMYFDLYHSFMSEYETLGHMTEVPTNQLSSCKYFLPHHGVLKEASSTTKLRVVFDGSAKTSNGKSLNDILLVGSTVQSPLYDILTRFRSHRYVFCADVEKMYRQIYVREEDRAYQCILWRKNHNEPIKTYKLNTVTYGTSSAPFLATRTLVEIAKMNEANYPGASKAIKHDMYVDDLMSGSNTIDEAKYLKEEINSLLENYEFPLRKWLSNSSSVLPDVTQNSNIQIEKSNSEANKVLGLYWNTSSDSFNFKVCLDTEFVATKRRLLSEASRIYDPLGLLSPTTVAIKILFQGLWLLKLNWDDPLPSSEAKQWKKLRCELPLLEKCSIPRWLNIDTTNSFEIHGFCDASQTAYSAVVYSRVKLNNEFVTQIIAAKTKVAPISQLSIPKLELCGAVLLVKLVNSIVNALKLPIQRIKLWTDSKIVLDWLSSIPRKWTTFIANRSAFILESYNREYWSHVSSHENPADCASRGLRPSELLNFNLWWGGPDWLNHDESTWKKQDQSFGTCEELRTTSSLLLEESPNQSVLQEIIAKRSSFAQMTRIVAVVRRFFHNRVIVRNKNSTVQPLSKSYITRQELNEAEKNIIRYEQNQYFAKIDLEQDTCLKGLRAFIDGDDIIRVGGRIDNSSADYEVKHPIIMSCKSHVASSIVRDIHHQFHHAGFTLVSTVLRRKFWIIKAKMVIRNVLRSCVKCFRQNPRVENQIMGDLPLARVEYERPFLKVGLDYGGPIMSYFKRARGQKPHKTYICLFVCMATKAIHIEVAMDLSTESFLAAFKRFTSRRGVCTDVFSDNGTNFVGANNQLKELFEFLNKNNLIIAHSLLADKIQWHFNPPTASHFGGLFETAIKSTKLHLKRVIGEHILTYEELMTLLTGIECTLNSRPLCLQSSETLEPLTPFHFILGQPATQLPSYNMESVKHSHLSHWQTVERMRQHFWKRWGDEYLTSLHQRSKWSETKRNLEIDDIVIIKNENLPPAIWKMARIIKLHPGKDNHVRVVTLKTSSGIIDRPIHKLCLLPIT